MESLLDYQHEIDVMGDRWIARADQLDGIDLSPAQILDPH
jgi:hypothetical protein